MLNQYVTYLKKGQDFNANTYLDHVVEDGEKNSWGNKDRDAIYLEYDVDFGFKQIATKDTLVLQTRGTNKLEVFAPKYKAN